jgi:hypothetical protein
MLWAMLIVVALVWVTGVFDRPEPKPESSASREPATSEPGAGVVPFHPNAVARALSAAPGAIVCPDFDSLSMLFHLYSDSWEEAAQDRATNGQARTIRGEAAPAPDPESLGCELFAPGTPVSVNAFTSGIPMVVAKLPDGKIFHGVTLPGMLSMRVQYDW